MNTVARFPAEPHARLSGAAILGDVAAFCGKYIAYPSEHAQVAHTLWIAHTHLMPAWDSTPRLALLSPEPGLGKNAHPRSVGACCPQSG